MRTLNWDESLSEEDIAWCHQSGIPGLMDRVADHQAKFGDDVPAFDIDEDPATKSALDPSAIAIGDPIPGVGQGSPRLIDPTQSDGQPDDEEGDDYDTWSKADLDAEVSARNAIEGAGDVTVVGTGKDGAVLKADLVKGLRLWDQENPGVLDAE